MLAPAQIPLSVCDLLEQLYLDSANKKSSDDYAKQPECEKHTTLLAFANEQAALSKRWAAIVADLRLVG